MLGHGIRIRADRRLDGDPPLRRGGGIDGVEADAVLGDHAQPGAGIHDAGRNPPVPDDDPDGLGALAEADEPLLVARLAGVDDFEPAEDVDRLRGTVGARHEDDGLAGCGRRIGLDGGSAGGGRGHGSHSTFAPDSLTTLPHLTISSLRKAENCSGVPLSTVAPSAAIFSRTSGICSTRTTSVFRRLTIGSAVPAFTRKPNQVLDSKPGKPDSATVGTSGRSETRLVAVTARRSEEQTSKLQFTPIS